MPIVECGDPGLWVGEHQSTLQALTHVCRIIN